MTCRNGHENPDEYSFCGSCGEPLEPQPAPQPPPHAAPEPTPATEQTLWPQPSPPADRKRQTLIAGLAAAAVLVVLGGVGGGLALAGVFDSGSSTPEALSSLKTSWSRYLFVRAAAANSEQADRLRNRLGMVRADFQREAGAGRVLAFETAAIKFPSAVRSDAQAFQAAVGKYQVEVQAAAADANGSNVNAHTFAVGKDRNALDVAYYRLLLSLQAR